MTINDLMALNDDELLAALQVALERAEADEVAASARVAKLARAIAAFSTSDDASPQRAKPEPLPPSTTPKDAGRSKPPAKRAAPASPASRPPKPCCGSLGPRHKSGCTGQGAAPVESAPKLAAVPDPQPEPASSAKVVERDPVAEAEPGSAYHFECSECPDKDFVKLRDLVMHCIQRHERQPKPIERRPIANEAAS